MTIILLIITSIILFVVGVLSPRRALRIQKHTHHRTHGFKRRTEWLWNPITWWLHGTADFIRKIIITVTHWGTSTRKKLPF